MKKMELAWRIRDDYLLLGILKSSNEPVIISDLVTKLDNDPSMVFPRIEELKELGIVLKEWKKTNEGHEYAYYINPDKKEIVTNLLNSIAAYGKIIKPQNKYTRK